MRPNIPLAVGALIDEYRRFLRTSYRFLDERLRGEIEERLLAAMRQIPGFVEGVRDHQIRDSATAKLVTVPDFAWLDEKVAVFCDRYAYHSAHDALVRDAQKRSWLQVQGWLVLTFWGRAPMRDSAPCAAQIASVLNARRAG